MATEKRLIDADALKQNIGKNLGEWVLTATALTLVDDATTIDAVEVVRCYKCLHWDDHNNGYGYCKHPHWRYAGEYDALTEHCDFCSYGEGGTENV